MWYNHFSTQCAEGREAMTEAGKMMLIRDEMSERIISAAEEIALEDGTDSLTVRKLLIRLGITNRVFYNRFKNISEVLSAVYTRSAHRVRGCITDKIDPDRDFFEQVNELVSEIILVSYDTRMLMSGFVFESDLNAEDNRNWWVEQIRYLLQYAIERGYVKPVNTEVVGYSIWCFIRGYNADVVARKVPRDEAIEGFRYTFSFLLDGLKA